MTIAGSIRAEVYAPKVAARGALYARRSSTDERLGLQLGLWNQEWARLIQTVPYYRDLATQAGKRAGFDSWDDFLRTVPVTTRALVKERVADMSDTARPAEFHRITGGSTAEPVRLPAWHSEFEHTRYDLWMARGWYGITPASRQFMLWGHSHLLGRGIKGQLNALRRRLKDRLLGYYRFSAYDLRPEVLKHAAAAMLEFRPDYLLGYSVALDLFARAVGEFRERLRALGLKVTVGAAEAFPAPDSTDRLKDTLNCPIAMEYGSVETDLLAHTTPEGGYRAFWLSYFMEAVREQEHAGAYRIRVTSLYPRCFPLVRYEIGDEVELPDTPGGLALGLDCFKRVLGRCNEFVLLPGGARIHSEAFTHAVRECTAILGYQVIAAGDCRLAIHYLSHEPLRDADIAGIKGRLERINPQLAGAEFRRVERLEQTLAGKTRMVVLK